MDVATDGVLRERETVRCLRLFIGGAFTGRGRRRVDGLIWNDAGPGPATSFG